MGALGTLQAYLQRGNTQVLLGECAKAANDYEIVLRCGTWARGPPASRSDRAVISHRHLPPPLPQREYGAHVGGAVAVIASGWTRRSGTHRSGCQMPASAHSWCSMRGT